MSLRALVLLVAMLAVPLAAASGFPPAQGAARTQVGDAEIAHWIGDPPSFATNATTTIAPNATSSLWFGLQNARSGEFDPNASRVAYVNVSSAALAIAQPNVIVEIQPATSLVYAFASTEVRAPLAAGPANYTFTVELYETNGNGTTLLASATGQGSIEVESVEVPPTAPPIPRTWLLAGIAVLVVGGGAAAILVRQRAVKRRMNEGPRRSQVMREMELEKQLERAKAKDPEAAVVIQQEIRQAEEVREKRRELQILEAKKADALKTLDLLRKRHEAGGLTKLQYDNMVAKKQQDLARIEAEIAEMERQDPGAAA